MFRNLHQRSPQRLREVLGWRLPPKSGIFFTNLSCWRNYHKFTRARGQFSNISRGQAPKGNVRKFSADKGDFENWAREIFGRQTPQKNTIFCQLLNNITLKKPVTGKFMLKLFTKIFFSPGKEFFFNSAGTVIIFLFSREFAEK